MRAMETLQLIVVLVLVALAVLVTVRHLLRQFHSADPDFSESGGCSNCPASGAGIAQTSIRGRSTRKRAKTS